WRLCCAAMDDAKRNQATREHHPSTPSRKRSGSAAKSTRGRAGAAAGAKPPGVQVPTTGKDALVAIGDRQVRLTNLDKPFWPALGIAKRDLLQYYADVAHA